MTTTTALKFAAITAAAATAVLCAGLEFAGIHALAAPRAVAAAPQIVHLPMVLVTAPREVAAAEVQRLPQVVVTGRRHVRDTATAQTPANADRIAS